MDPFIVQQQMDNHRPRHVPFDKAFPFLFPKLDADRVIQLQNLFDQYMRDEIPSYSIGPRMIQIVGRHLFRLAIQYLESQNFAKSANKNA